VLPVAAAPLLFCPWLAHVTVDCVSGAGAASGQKHHAMQQVLVALQETPADREPLSLVLVCKVKPNPQLLELELWVQLLDPIDQGSYCHSRVLQRCLDSVTLCYKVRLTPVGVAPALFAPTNDTLIGILCHPISELLISTSIV
jgi:hypothetical protein